jgi:hypothetical protein
MFLSGVGEPNGRVQSLVSVFDAGTGEAAILRVRFGRKLREA